MYTQLLYPGAAPDDDTGTPLRDGAFILNNMIARLTASPWRFPVQAIVTAPPASPQHQQRWLVGPGSSGAFAGRTHQIAEWVGTPEGSPPIAQWHFEAPSLGAFLYCASLDALLRWDGAAWISFAVAGPPGPQGIPGPQGPQGPAGPPGSSGGGSLTVAKDGVPIVGAASTLNFTGTGVTVTGPAPTATITLGGGGPVGPTDPGTPPVWTAGNFPEAGRWLCGEFGGGRFVFLNSSTNRYVHSTDGLTWTGAALPVTGDWWVSSYGNGRFVMPDANAPRAITSVDGLTWVEASLHGDNNTAIAFGSGRFVSLGNNAPTYNHSADGLTWTAGTLPLTSTWGGMAFGANRFVAVSETDGKVITSTDGLSWSVSDLPEALHCTWVCYGLGRFLVATLEKRYLTSTDGLTWTIVNLPLDTPDAGMQRVHFGGGRFLGAGPNNSILTSSDGLGWTVQPPLTGESAFFATAYGSGRFVVVAAPLGGSSVYVSWQTP